MIRPIVVYGAGGHGREVAALIRALGRGGLNWELQGFLSDDAASWGHRVAGLPILGDGGWLFGHPGVSVALGVGNSAARRRVVAALLDRSVDFPTLVHPSAVVMESGLPGRGVVIAAGAVVTVDAILGDFSVLNVNASVSHDCRVADFGTLGPAVTLTGGGEVGAGADLGAGVVVLPRVRIGEWSVVGAGAVITRELPPNCTAVGIPARVISVRQAGWQLAPDGR